MREAVCFMLDISIIEPLFLLRRLMKLYKERKKDLHMVFIDLQTLCDRVSRDVLLGAKEGG